MIVNDCFEIFLDLKVSHYNRTSGLILEDAASRYCIHRTPLGNFAEITKGSRQEPLRFKVSDVYIQHLLQELEMLGSDEDEDWFFREETERGIEIERKISGSFLHLGRFGQWWCWSESKCRKFASYAEDILAMLDWAGRMALRTDSAVRREYCGTSRLGKKVKDFSIADFDESGCSCEFYTVDGTCLGRLGTPNSRGGFEFVAYVEDGNPDPKTYSEEFMHIHYFRMVLNDVSYWDAEGVRLSKNICIERAFKKLEEMPDGAVVTPYELLGVNEAGGQCTVLFELENRLISEAGKHGWTFDPCVKEPHWCGMPWHENYFAYRRIDGYGEE